MRNPAAVLYEGYRNGDESMPKWHELSDDEVQRWWSALDFQAEVAKEDLKNMEEGRY